MVKGVNGATTYTGKNFVVVIFIQNQPFANVLQNRCS